MSSQIIKLQHRHGVAAGFSLIEIMIVVAIIAIVAAIALPSYVEYQRKARRAAGGACVVAAAQQMERFYTTAMAYNATGAPTVAQLQAFCDPEALDYYTISRDTFAARTFRINATPAGKHEGDSCGVLRVNQAGVKSPATAGCW